MRPRFVRLITNTWLLFIIIYSLAIKDYNYIIDSIIFILISGWLSWNWHDWKLDKAGYIGIHAIMILHTLGRFGAFNWHFIFDYDVYMHIASGIALALLCIPVMKPIQYNRSKGVYIITLILIVAGFATLNEITEFTGHLTHYNLQGMFATEANPLLKIADFTPEYADTMKDALLTTGAGCVTIILSQYLKRRKKIYEETH